MDVRLIGFLHRDHHEPTVFDTAFRYHLVGALLHVVTSPPEDRHFHAALMIEVDVQGGLGQVVMVMERLNETSCEVAG